MVFRYKEQIYAKSVDYMLQEALTNLPLVIKGFVDLTTKVLKDYVSSSIIFINKFFQNKQYTSNLTYCK